jgi:hypothetical protein
MGNKQTFETELRRLINRTCRENESNTPDFILAKYLAECLNSFNSATRKRDNWYGHKQSILEEETKTKWS